MAMKFELLNFCEIDKDASKSYCAIHNVPASLNLGDICGVDIESLPKNYTLLTHGSPCTSFSNAGLQLGGDRGSGTPSSLMWNSVEIIKHTKPKFVIWENVSNVLSPKHKHNFDEYINELEKCGYHSDYKVMNAKDYGTPQNRNRIFVISILKEIDKGFNFPDEVSLNDTLHSKLEKEVEEKWYLTQKQIDRIHTTTYASGKRRIQYKDWTDTLCARDWKDPKCVEVDGRVRKLTPREYWRLMGFSDTDFNLASSTGISNSQLYKQAGNSIAYSVIKGILYNLSIQYPEEFKDGFGYISLFSGVGAFEMALRDL
jgi:DNA (cytosine-5)-methyltransferase 1